MDITIPTDPTDPIALDGGTSSVRIALPYTGRADNAAIEKAGVVSFDNNNNNGSTIVPVVQKDGSVQINTIIETAKAPIEYAYPVSVPAGGKLQAEPRELSVLDATGGWVAGFLPAWAKDANGAAVYTHYEIRGDTLVQVVEHDRPNVTYPVVADPWLGVNLINHWWWTGSGNSRAVHIDVTPMMGVVTEAIAIWVGRSFQPNRV
ncbi:hypothetical protein Lxx02310 [Leifsonia xyli subsp. xyli str. CTCB07]|uniref:Uncharacterized protein n=1 Tax=Leifsonia xyli subsp. xyli (strain CTCB07) TaxID=281090 RepID=Q6AH65_LEIXX|nr:hypothetical protein Lxx02310 [Leifsonia xyli subsp. xyli str. CTCB07]